MDGWSGGRVLRLLAGLMAAGDAQTLAVDLENLVGVMQETYTNVPA